MGSLVNALPSSTSYNTNHHYGMFFNTNASTKQTKDQQTKDKKRMKNLKHIKKMCKEKNKNSQKGKYFMPLTERHQHKRRGF